ncbi:alpha-galactosidase [Sphingomonas elodea]|uniref:alpha-galactosidase n=1 Tax=Sphingomonas elodea TaxID=179878 RepID=UPI0002630868|nr:alpha-galactosidase [Sphingomonas elodea]
MTDPFVRLDGRATCLIVDCRGEAPAILYWGRRLPDDLDPAALALLGVRQEAPCSPATTPPLGLTPLIGAGFPGRPGLSAHRDGQGWATWTAITAIHRIDAATVEIDSEDTAHGIGLVHRLHLAGDVLRMRTTLINRGDTALSVEACDAPALPAPEAVTDWTLFEGRWSGELQTRRVARAMGAVARENRRGRTSHDAFPAILAEVGPCGEQAGEVFGVQLAWSGNHRLWAETLSDGRAYLQLGELFLPGECRLAPGARYTSPDLVCAWSDAGRSGLARAFHAHVRARPQHDRLRAKPRPVHYNTWEAVYFDHKPAALMALADKAAAIGIERFVLDDGWFLGRRDDTVGLGDWIVDPAIYSDGLGPLVAHVRKLGMEFGLWVEPEMVNPDSELFRAHPEWVLGTPPAPQLRFRNQLVLDFGQAAVREHLFERIDALLREHAIAYLKWDMNRDITHPGGAGGAAGAHAHVLGLYEVLARLRAAHPSVEIESCSAGGGRTDFGILDYTDRVWTSDTNDALDRLTIQRGLSTFVPAELMGAHVGPADCHITGRRVGMATRVATALFGHFGVEADLNAMEDAERAELAAGIALHKRHRALIHTGDLYRLDRPESEIAFGIVAADQREALFSYTQVTEPRGYFAAPLRLDGLDPAARYRVTLAWPGSGYPASPLFAALGEGAVFSGAALMAAGLQPPRLKPQAAFLLHLERIA